MYKGTSTIRISKWQMLTKQFKEFRMQKDENIVMFSRKLRDIANKAFQLGETYSKEKPVRKTLRSLPMSFGAKAAVVVEAKDIAKMTFDDL